MAQKSTEVLKKKFIGTLQNLKSARAYLTQLLWIKMIECFYST
jgi:hypothetical protein